MEKNKYHYDLKNVHYVPGTKNEDGSITYTTPKRLPGAMNMDISPEGDTSKIRADGMDYIVIVSNNGYSGTLTMVQVPDDFKIDCLTEKEDEVNMIQYEDANAETRPFALLFEFAGDKKNRRHVFYNCTASRTSVKGENKDNQKEPDTEEIQLSVSPILAVVDGDEKNIVKSSTKETTTQDVYNAWFTQVILPGQAPEKSAKLSSLSIGAVKLTPEFSADTKTYTATTTNATNTVKAVAADSKAEIEIKNGSAVIANNSAATWTDGENVLSVKVTNGEITETYSVTVTKG